MRILGISHALPSRKVSNQELIQTVIERSRHVLPALSPRLIQMTMHRAFKTSGTEIRYHRANDERAIDFGIKAGRNALKLAGIQPQDIDLLIYSGVGRGWIEPATANLFQSALGLCRATCFDVLDACASWIRSLVDRTLDAEQCHDHHAFQPHRSSAGKRCRLLVTESPLTPGG